MQDRWLLLFGLGAGCAVAPPTETAAPAAGLTRSEPFALAGPSAAPPVIEASGEGVSVRWAGAAALSQPAQSEGDGPVVATRREATGAVTLVHRDGVEETWASTAAGVEQSWRYAARPAGDRAAVTVSFAGAALDHEADDGLWLRTATGALLRYGHATWVDAAGRRTAVRSRWVDGRVALVVPAEVVAAAAYPAVLDPTVTPAFAVEAPTELTSGPMSYVQLARTSTGSLVFSPLVSSETGRPATTLIMVQRLDAAHARVEGSFRPVAATSTITGNYRVASAGGGAWIVWQEGARVVGVRLDANGNAIDPAPVALLPDTSLIELACNATRCLVLGSRGAQLVVGRFTPAGVVLDAAPVVVATPPGGTGLGGRPLVALDDRFVVAWSEVPAGDTPDVRLARVGLDGTVQDPGGRPVTTAGVTRTNPSLASSGASVFVTFSALASGSRPGGLYALALDRDLAPLSPLTVLSGVGGGPLWDGARWLVADTARVVRFAPDGARLDATPLPVAGSSSGSAGVLGSDGGGFFVYRNGVDPRTGSSASVVQRVASDGSTSGPPAAVSISYEAQTAPAVESDGTTFLASWFVTSASPRLARLSAAGVWADAPPLRTALPGFGMNNVGAMLLEGSTAQVYGDISGGGLGRFSVDLAARTHGTLTTVASYPGRVTTVRGNGQRLAFCLGLSRGNPPPGGTVIVRFDVAGARLDASPIVLPVSSVLAADFDGARYLMAYANNTGAAYARRLDASGDFTEVSPRSLAALGPVFVGLRLAFGGGAHLVAWIDPSRQVRATRLGLDGAPLDATPLTLGPAGDYTDVSLSFNGRNFVVVWLNATSRRLLAARVSPAGALLDATPLTLTEPQARTSVGFGSASDAQGSTLVAYDVFVRDYAATVVRGLFLRDDGAVVPDAGVLDAGVDVPVAADVPVAVDVPATVDVPVAVDVPATADVPVADAAPAIDAGSPVDASSDAGPSRPDVVPTTDRGAVADAGSPTTDVGTSVTDAGTPAADAGAAPPDDGGGLCSVQSGVGAGRVGLRGSSLLLLGAAALLRRRRRR